MLFRDCHLEQEVILDQESADSGSFISFLLDFTYDPFLLGFQNLNLRNEGIDLEPKMIRKVLYSLDILRNI